MSNQLKIKISIANRVYPLTINPSQEEGLRKAAKKIEAMIGQFEQSYSVRDKQDVLAMCALQFASKLEISTLDTEETNTEALDKIHELTKLVSAHLE